MSLLIQNGEIITADERYTADIYCEGETITRIAKDLSAPPGTEIIDASGKFVFPGFIDPHVHLHLPYKDTFAKDTYETGTRAALMGGTTCVMDFCTPAPGQDPMEAFDIWTSMSMGKAACDYTWHLSVTRFDDRTEPSIHRIVADEGITSFKIFLAYKGALGISDEELYGVLGLAKRLGVITAAHCENADIVSSLQNKLISEGKTGPEWHYHSRPPYVEAEGTGRLMTFARAHDAHVYVVHLSCDEALREAMRAKHAGVHAHVETLIQYLTLDMSYAELAEFEGAKYVMSPPLRKRSNQDILWNAIRQRFISTVATDHAPFDFKDQKYEMGKNDFTNIPNGIPSLEERIKLLYTHGVIKGRIDIHTFVDCASTQAAKIFGLFPRKGTIQPGSDADMVVFDPEHEDTITADTHAMNIDYSAFEGWKVMGRPEVVTVRGEVAVQNGSFVGTYGRGRRIQREPNHF